MKKQIAAALLALCLVLSIMPVGAYTVKQGTCGANLTWALDNSGVLTVSGTGNMTDFNSESNVPWYDKRGTITSVVISSGVTSIGMNAFYKCENLKTATVPLSVTQIGRDAFGQNKQQILIYYAGSQGQWRQNVTVPIGFSYTLNLAKFDVEVFSGHTHGTVSGGGIYAPNAYVTVTATAEPGYRFTEWTESNSTVSLNPRYSFTVKEDRRLMAQFDDFYYKVCFRCEGDSSVDLSILRTGADNKLSSLPTPNRSCYSFEGWFLNLDDEAPITTETVFTKDTDVYAKWSDHHTLEILPGKEPTCTTDGWTEGLKCSVCNTYFTKQEFLKATGHQEEDIPAVPATCTVNGSSLGKRCSACGITLQEPDIIPAAHTGLEPLPAKAPTCEDTGLTKGEHCTTCGAITEPQTVLDAWGHSWGEESGMQTTAPTCTEKGVITYTHTCTTCGKCEATRTKDIDALKHSWGEVNQTTTKEPSCTEDGERTCTQTCTRSGCNEVKTWLEKIDMVPHTRNPVPGKAATCTEEGLTDGVNCSVCGTIIQEQKTIPRKEHNWVAVGEEMTSPPTCIAQGEKTVTEMCTGCKQTKTRTETLGMVDHTWREEIIIEKEPTCTTAGAQYIRRTCTVCSSMVALPGEPIPATGIHTLEPIPGKAATCTEDGYTEGSVCSVCGAVLKKTETINALAHAWGDEKESVTKPATCTETGIMTYTKVCQRPGCSAESTRTEDIAILNHQWGAEDAGVVKKPATCTEKGIRTYTKTCAVCHTEEHRDEDINPNGHTEADILAVSPTCTTDGKTAGKECSVCHTLLEAPQTIPAAHTNVMKIPGKDADCENKGLTEGKKCTACGTIIEAQIETGPLGHDWNGGGVETVIKQPTCKEEGEKRIEGAVCTRCNASKAAVTQTIPKTAHNDIEEISGKAASCEETGLTSGKRCRTCGDILEEQTTISALGHDWVEDGNSTETVTKAPTCTAAGEKIITGGVKCSRCPATDSQSRTVSIQPNGHSFGTAAEEITKQPTCTEKGVKVLTKTCTVCGEKQTETKKLNPTGHTWGEWTTVTQPTATEAGSEKRLCSVCHEEETRVLPATGVTPGGNDKPSDNLRYRIFTPGSTYGGSFSVSHSSAVRGTRITIELDPWHNFETDRLSVTNLNTGREVRLTQHYSDTYTFTMPAGDVELDLSYADIGSVDTYFILPDPPVKTGPNAWYYRDRHIYHATNGLVPDRTPITRDMLISVLYNLTDWSTSTTIGCETNDSQVWATNYHIVPDIHDSGLSGFDKSLNREQASVLIFRYAGYRGCNTSQRSDLTRYSDYTRVHSFARSAMSWTLATELMKATTSSTLSPQADITCGETGTLLSHFLSGVVWMK